METLNRLEVNFIIFGFQGVLHLSSIATVDLQVAIFASFSNEQKNGIFWVKNGGFLRMVKVDIFVFDQP